MKSSGDVEALVAAVVLGKPLAEIASQAGISVSTVQRRLREPEAIAAINEARGRHRAETLGRMTDLRTRALDRLQELLGDEDSGIVLRAVTLVLTTSTRFERDYELADRVAALESQEDVVEAASAGADTDVA